MPIDPKQLHSRILSGDKAAEEELAEFVQDLARDDYHKTLGPLAEDYLQDLGIRVLLKVRQNFVEHPQWLVTFCQTIIGDVRIDGIRAAARDARRILRFDDSPHEFRGHQSIEEDVIHAQQLQIAWELIDGLEDPLTREVIVRACFEHQSMRQMEREMDLSVNQIRGRKERGIQQLRQDYESRNRGFRLLRGGRKDGGFRAAA